MKRIRRRTYLNMGVRELLLLFVTVLIVSSTVLLGQRRRSGKEDEPLDTTKPTRIITQFFPDPMTPRTMGGLVAGSDLVIEGIVTDMLGSYLNGPNNMGEISTETEITIRNVLRGREGGPRAPVTVTVRLAGGKVGKAHEIIRDQPPFELGEEYILFLERIVGEQREVYQPIGFSRGRFKVINNRVYPTVLTDIVGSHHVGKDLDLFVDEIGSTPAVPDPGPPEQPPGRPLSPITP